jgi:hypothetical protein
MARFRSETTTIAYAGRVIYDGSAAGQSLVSLPSISRQYTTTAEEIVDAATPTIRAYGNAGGAFPVAVIIEYPSEEAAFDAELGWADFTDANQTGELSVDVGSITRRWRAGVDSLEVEQQFSADTVRLVLRFGFILGEKITE